MRPLDAIDLPGSAGPGIEDAIRIEEEGPDVRFLRIEVDDRRPFLRDKVDLAIRGSCRKKLALRTPGDRVDLVLMLGHPTGRLLLMRKAYPVNLEKILDCAAETGTWIELNAQPLRLDLDWRWWHAARDKGVRCVINPDAHHIRELGFLRIGVNIARKGWLRREDVINTLSLKLVEGALRKKRGDGG